MLVFASKGARELPNSRVYLDGALEGLSRGGTFVGQHICVPLEGAAVHINAFNFPVWGMLEKLAPALLAGVPAIVKPATATSYLTELVVRRIVETGILPPGALQLICGGVGDLFDHLGCQDVVSFTGSAATAAKLRTHPAVVRHSVRFVAETDSLNSSILGPDAGPGTPEFALFVQEVAREMTVKAGQKCTAIRKALVPKAMLGEVVAALAGEARRDRRRRPARRGRRHGAAREPRAARRGARARRRARTRVRAGRGRSGADSSRRAATAGRAPSCAPILLLCRDAAKARAVHSVEAFGPVSTVIGYDGTRGRDRARAPRRGQPRRLHLHRRRRGCRRTRPRARALPRARAGREPALREGIDRSRLAARAAGARRARPRRRRRGTRRHPRRAALHAAHGRAGHSRHRSRRSAGAGRAGAPSATRASTRSASRSTHSRSATPSTRRSARSRSRTSSASRISRATISTRT